MLERTSWTWTQMRTTQMEPTKLQGSRVRPVPARRDSSVAHVDLPSCLCGCVQTPAAFVQSDFRRPGDRATGRRGYRPWTRGPWSRAPWTWSVQTEDNALTDGARSAPRRPTNTGEGGMTGASFELQFRSRMCEDMQPQKANICTSFGVLISNGIRSENSPCRPPRCSNQTHGARRTVLHAPRRRLAGSGRPCRPTCPCHRRTDVIDQTHLEDNIQVDAAAVYDQRAGRTEALQHRRPSPSMPMQLCRPMHPSRPAPIRQRSYRGHLSSLTELSDLAALRGRPWGASVWFEHKVRAPYRPLAARASHA